MGQPPEHQITALRRLARGLLYDRGLAEDAVQEAWLVALRRGLLPSDGAGSWLFGAVRRIARGVLREEDRRQGREREAARAEATPSAAEASARIEILRRLLETVDRLDEPYRTAIVLRFFDELPPREIARRMRLPVNTVRTHVRRGLERLRRELDGEHGRGREAFLTALAPLAGRMPWTQAVGLPVDAIPISNLSGAIVVSSKTLTATAVALALGLSWIVVRSLDEPVRAPREVAGAIVAPTPNPEAAAPDVGPDAPSSEAREPVAATEGGAPRSWLQRGFISRGHQEPYPHGRLIGRVYEGAGVEGEPLLEERLTAGADGVFEWALEAPTRTVTVAFEADMEQRLNTPTWGFFSSGDPPYEAWTVDSLALDVTVLGRVRDADGQPAAGVRVIYEAFQRNREVQCGADGRYSIRLPSRRGPVRLIFLGQGFAQARLDLHVSEPGEIDAPEVVLAPERILRGRVVDQTGAAVEGAEVASVYAYRFEPVHATSDSTGAFEIGALDPAQTETTLYLRKPGFATATQQVSLDRSEIEIRLTRGVRVLGRVLSQQRTPVPGAWISVGLTPGSMPSVETWSDDEGRFQLEDLPMGMQHFWVSRTGFAQRREAVDVPEGVMTFEGVEIELRRGHFVGGIVLDHEDRPIPWALVDAEDPGYRQLPELWGFQTSSGPDGRFRIDGLPDQTLTVGVVTRGYSRLEQVVDRLDRDDLVLRPARSGALAGRVVDAETGLPVRSFVLRLTRIADLPMEEQLTRYSGNWARGVSIVENEGRWRIDEGLPLAKWTAVQVEAGGYAPAQLERVETTLAPDPEACVLRLVRGTLVRGRVVAGESGAPLAGARVRRLPSARSSLRQPDRNAPSFEATTDSAGRFELRDVPTGSMALGVELAGWPTTVDGPFEIAGSAAVERWIELGPGATLRGHLLDAGGHGLGGMTISLRVLEGIERPRDWKITTTEDGAFEVAHLAPGVFHLGWQRELAGHELNDLLQLLTLQADETLEVRLQPCGRASVRGTLEFAGPAPAVVPVRLTRLPAPGEQVQTAGAQMSWAKSGRATFAEDGHFAITGLEPGTYSVLVSLTLKDGSEASGSARVEVPEAGEVEVHLRVEPLGNPRK